MIVLVEKGASRSLAHCYEDNILIKIILLTAQAHGPQESQLLRHEAQNGPFRVH